MTVSSKRKRLTTTLVALTIAAFALAGSWQYVKDAAVLSARTPGVQSPPATGNGEGAMAPHPSQPTAPPPANVQRPALPWRSPSLALPPAGSGQTQSAPSPGSAPATAATEDGGQPARPDAAKTTAAPDEQHSIQAGTLSEILPAIADADLNAKSAPHNSEQQTEASPEEQPPLIVYGKGRAVDAKGTVIQGEIPERQLPPDTADLYGSPGADSQNGQGHRDSPRGEDSIVGLSVIQEMAQFLVSNYWPAGTHPLARGRGVTTASVKWANVKFGAQLQGFSVNQTHLSQERTRVLNYMFMPSMIRGLYDLYAERFVNALEREALSQRRGPGKKPLSRAERAEMFMLYGATARGLAGTIRAYAGTPDVRALVKACIETDRRAEEANHRFFEAMQTNASSGASLTRRYRTAVLQRDQQREQLLAALRRNGIPRGLDSEIVMYTALWLYRRGDDAGAATEALAEILDLCAARLEEHSNRNNTDRKTPTAETKN